MFPTLIEQKHSLQDYIRKVAESNETIAIQEVATLFTTNAIASIAFGLEVDCFADPNSPFRECGRRCQEPGFKMSIRNLFFHVCAKLMKWTGLHFLDSDVEDFFFNIVRQTLKMREEKGIVRKDFFQLLVQLRNIDNVQLMSGKQSSQTATPKH